MASSDPPFQTARPLNGFGRLRRWLLHRLWYVHPGGELRVSLPPLDCLRQIISVSKPDVRKLEYRDLFNGGRRYHIYTIGKGFVVLTTQKVIWRARGRTASSTVVQGVMTAEAKGTHIRLSARLHPAYFVSSPAAFLSLVFPLFISSMVLSTPWSWWIKGTAAALVISLAWAAHWLTMALESSEIIHFIHQSLDAYRAAEPLALQTSHDVVYDATRFAQAWENFYKVIKHDL